MHKKSPILKAIFFLGYVFLFSESTTAQNKKNELAYSAPLEEALSSLELEQIKKNNIQHKTYEYTGVKIQYAVVINSVRVSPEDSTSVVQGITNIHEGVECFFNPRTYSLIVKSDKSNKYLNIVEIQNVLLANNLHLMTFQEILYKN